MIKGIVASSKPCAEGMEYIIITKSGKAEFVKSNLPMKVGASVEVKAAEGIAESFVQLEESGAEEIRKNLEHVLSSSILEPEPQDDMHLEAVSKKMHNALMAAAKLFLLKFLTGTPIVVRFHNDADGSSGAYALYKSISNFLEKNEAEFEPRVSWRMQRGISYSEMDAITDVMFSQGFDSVEKPLLVVIDFGTSEMSNHGLKRLNGRFDVIWLDHHPLIEEFMGLNFEHYINPWNFEADSNYTAGVLACVFAKHIAPINTDALEQASMIGDYSIFANPDNESINLSMLLDLLTSDKRVAFPASGSNLTPIEINSVLNDSKKKKELLAYAKNTMEDALDSALQSVKIYKAKGALIYVANFAEVRDIASKIKYPLPGRFSSKLLEHIQSLNEKPCIVIVHYGHYISLRCGKDIVNLGALVKEIKQEHDAVESAGGHSSAVSIKLYDDFEKKSIINLVVKKLKALL